jgi:hypothetical protein
MVVFLLPVGMLIVSHIRAGSTQLVPGTVTTAGEIIKLVIISNPPNTAAGGTLRALPTC